MLRNLQSLADNLRTTVIPSLSLFPKCPKCEATGQPVPMPQRRTLLKRLGVTEAIAILLPPNIPIAWCESCRLIYIYMEDEQ